MPARPIASATVSFGLVSVPVQLFSSADSEGGPISFRMLHKKDGAPLKQQYICTVDQQIVERSEMAKGYEVQKGQYVQFSPEEIKALDEKGNGSIDINEFVPAAKVDRRYVDRTYFLGPDKGGERAYHLLAEALKQSGRAALGQYAARGKQYLILVRELDGGLAMEQLHYAHEVRSIKEVGLGDVPVKEGELKLAMQLIDQGATDEFKPENYTDKVRERVLEAIEKKVQSGTEITAEPEAAPQTKIIDLMEALKASVAQKKETEQEETSEAKKPAKRRKKAS